MKFRVSIDSWGGVWLPVERNENDQGGGYELSIRLLVWEAERIRL